MIIAIEGIDGSGKTTQAKLLTEWLRGAGHKVSTTRWNSSPIVTLATHKAKKSRSLTPRLHSLLAAADFCDRLENEIQPALAQGEIIVADRWTYTAYARDSARGLNLKWIQSLYEGALAVDVDVCFYLQTAVDTALARILADRRLKHYESGMDLNLSADIAQSFRLFQTKVSDFYERTIDGPPPRFILIPGDLTIEAQQEQICKSVARMVTHAATV